MSAWDGYLYVTDGPLLRVGRIGFHLFLAWVTWQMFGSSRSPLAIVLIALPLLIANSLVLWLFLSRKCTPSERGVAVAGVAGVFEVTVQQPKRVVVSRASVVGAIYPANVAVIFDAPVGHKRQVVVASTFATSDAIQKAQAIASWVGGDVEVSNRLPYSPLRQLIHRLARE